MERESFENENIAAIMNEHYVNIKVDREERPDIDKTYMTFIQVKIVTILQITKKEGSSRLQIVSIFS